MIRWLAMSTSLAIAIVACSSDSAPGTGGDSSSAPDGSRSDEAGTEGGTRPGDGASGDDVGDVGDGGDDHDGGVDAGPVGELFAFVGSNDAKIRTYKVDAATATWTFLNDVSVALHPSFLAFDPSRRRVVAIDEEDPGFVLSYSFDPTTGALTLVNSKNSGGDLPTHLSFDPTGKWVMVANFLGGNMSIFPIDANGTLGDASDTKASGANSHWAGTNPSGGYVFVPALGANVISQYKLDSATGKLTDNGSASLPNGAGPRHLAFHPTEKWAYSMNETAISVTALDFDKSTGKLAAKQTISALPDAQSTNGVSGAEIFVHPSGKHVYASTRVYNSIVHFAVNQADGTVTRIENVPTGGDRPRNFGMDPEGTLLFAGNQEMNQVVGFRINAQTGDLTSLGKTVDVTFPSFVGLVRIP